MSMVHSQPSMDADANAGPSPSTDAPAPPSSSSPIPPPPPPPKSSRSPPRADTVVRPFTSQGPAPAFVFGDSHPFHHPVHAHRDDSAIGVGQPPRADVGPYTSASARTSYTRVDVESLPAPVYPPLPPLPAAFVAPAGVASDADVGDTTNPAVAAVAREPKAQAQAQTPAPVQTPIAEPVIPQMPQVSLTFLLVSGRRKTQTFEPETTVGRVKELVWNAWPARDAEWQDERPPAPSYLRILYLGKILQDDDTLLRIGFPTSLPSSSTLPTIVHLSIRPYALPSEDLALSKKKRLSIAISRRLSTGGVGVGIGVGVGVPGNDGRDSETEDEAEGRRTGCCTGCTIC